MWTPIIISCLDTPEASPMESALYFAGRIKKTPPENLFDKEARAPISTVPSVHPPSSLSGVPFLLRSRRMVLLSTILFAGGAALGANLDLSLGETTVAKWRNGCKAAVALAFDDSLWSHVDYVIPLLYRKGLSGSFWVNPATDRYAYGAEMWEDRALALGMELCSHTMNHTGAESPEEADYEIGECTKLLRSLRPPGSSKLMLFLRGGATTWKITDRQMASLIRQYDLLRGRGGGVGHGAEEKSGAELVGFVKEAEADGGFHCIAFHGVGDNAEWLETSRAAFEKLVKYLSASKRRVWTGTCGEVHKYEREFKTAKAAVISAGAEQVAIALSCSENPAYYDAPLTLESKVPKSWKRCLVTQAKKETVKTVRNGIVRYEAVPNAGGIILERTSRNPMTERKSRPESCKQRKPVIEGKTLFEAGKIPAGNFVTADLGASCRETWTEFSFRLSHDFRIPQDEKDAGNSACLLSLAGTDGQPLDSVQIHRRGNELALYVHCRDSKDWHGIPSPPTGPGTRLQLKKSRSYQVLLKTRAGRRDGGVELWLDGRLRSSFMRRDTTGLEVRSLKAGLVSAPPSMSGTIEVGKLRTGGK